MLPPNAATQIMAAIREADNKARSHSQQILIDTAVGEQWFELSTSKEENDASSGTFIMLSRNITRRKQAELEREQAISEIKRLEGIIPIYSYCNSVRDDEGAWKRLDAYVAQHTKSKFSHGICTKYLPKLCAESGLDKKYIK